MTLLNRIQDLAEDRKEEWRNGGWLLNVPLDEMLEVLQCFQPGDAAALLDLAEALQEDNWKAWEDEVEMLKRMKEAAEKMEQP